MNTGAHVRPEPSEAVDRRSADRRAGTRRIHDRCTAEILQLEAIREAFDRELDAGNRLSFEVVARICHNFAEQLRARGGSL